MKLLCLATALDNFATVHEGHGQSRWAGSVLHWLLEPVHLPLTLCVCVVLVLFVGWRRGARALCAERARDAR